MDDAALYVLRLVLIITRSGDFGIVKVNEMCLSRSSTYLHDINATSLVLHSLRAIALESSKTSSRSWASIVKLLSLRAIYG